MPGRALAQSGAPKAAQRLLKAAARGLLFGSRLLRRELSEVGGHLLYLLAARNCG